jgi:excisionase family DNA binding protein
VKNLDRSNDLIDAAEVAVWLGVALSTVYDQATRGVIPHVRLWRRSRRTLIRFRRGDIETFVRDRTITPQTPGE